MDFGTPARVAATVAFAFFAAACATPSQPTSAGDGANAASAEIGDRDAHGSIGDFLATHFAAEPWRDNVVRDYLTASPVLLPVGLAVAAGAVAPWDRSMERHLEGKYSGHSSRGDVALGVLVVGSVAVGVFAPGPGRSAGDEFWNQAESFALTEVATSGIKLAVGRRRPHSGDRTSFPSGHASTAFAAATLLYRNSGPAVGLPAFGVAAFAGFSRVESGRHFPSDVLAGAALGALSAGVIDALHFGTGREGRGISRRGPQTDIGLEVGPDGRPVAALTIRF